MTGAAGWFDSDDAMRHTIAMRSRTHATDAHVERQEQRDAPDSGHERYVMPAHGASAATDGRVRAKQLRAVLGRLGATQAPTSGKQQASDSGARRGHTLVVEDVGEELVIRVAIDRGDAANDMPAMITQRNCERVGLTKRQFLELVRSGKIPGGPIPGTRIIAARLEDVLHVVSPRCVQGASPQPNSAAYRDDQGDVESVLADLGMRRRRRGR